MGTQVERARWGFATKQVENPANVVSLTSTAARVLPHNANRVSWTIVNMGDEVCWAGPSSAVSTTRGLPVAPNGGTLGRDADVDGSMVTDEVWGVSPSAANTIYSEEIVSLGVP